jgi:NADPH:quinone reductase-like Zn-dependent oxidoreductase
MWPSRHATFAPLPGNVDFTVGASRPISGLTAWQGLLDHGRLHAGQSVLAHGAAGAVGTMVTQLAREGGAYVIGTGRAADRQTALDFGANEFVDLDNDSLEDVSRVDLVFDVIGGDIQKRSANLIRAGGTLVTVVGPSRRRRSGAGPGTPGTCAGGPTRPEDVPAINRFYCTQADMQNTCSSPTASAGRREERIPNGDNEFFDPTRELC